MKAISMFLAFLLLPVFGFAALPNNYEQLTAAQKQEILWANISANEYSVLPTQDSALPNPELFNPYFLVKSFTYVADEIQPGRKKLVHTYGTAAKISLKITNSKYAGIFKTGGIGIARLSIASMAKSKTAFIPGLAVKIFVDGNPSVNFHAINSVDGQGSDQFFFARPVSNILPEPKTFPGKLINGSFSLAVNLLNYSMKGKGPISAGHLPLLQACGIGAGVSANAGEGTGTGTIAGTVAGTADSAPCPYQVVFTPMVAMPADGKLEDDFRKDLAKIPAGTVLYSVEVRSSSGSDLEEIGEIITDSGFVASSYEDRELFFAHASLGR